MSDKPERGPRLPPRWFIRLAWSVHRGLYRATGGRVGLRRPRGNRWGTLRLTTTGRRTGRKHSVIIAYLEDGPNLIAMAMNGWADGEPAWWLNLQARPDASVDLVDGPRPVRARVAKGTNGRACGAGGAKSTRSWTPMRRSGRPRPRW
jgi:deazaflavin-dependent oxidoreductase (nitroreductase family)